MMSIAGTGENDFIAYRGERLESVPANLTKPPIFHGNFMTECRDGI